MTPEGIPGFLADHGATSGLLLTHYQPLLIIIHFTRVVVPTIMEVSS